MKQLYDYKYITFEVYYNISLVVGLLFYLLVIGTIVYKYRYAGNNEEKKRLNCRNEIEQIKIHSEPCVMI